MVWHSGQDICETWHMPAMWGRFVNSPAMFGIFHAHASFLQARDLPGSEKEGKARQKQARKEKEKEGLCLLAL